MTVGDSIRNYVRRRVTLWERRRTERYIRALPPELQKDIGWADDETFDEPSAYRRNGLLERRW